MEFACILAAIGCVFMVTAVPSLLSKKKVGCQEFFILTCVTAFFLFAATNFILTVIIIWGGQANAW